MRDVYHCTPLEFDKQPAHVVELHMRFLSLFKEAEHVARKRAEQANKRNRRK